MYEQPRRERPNHAVKKYSMDNEKVPRLNVSIHQIRGGMEHSRQSSYYQKTEGESPFKL